VRVTQLGSGAARELLLGACLGSPGPRDLPCLRCAVGFGGLLPTLAWEPWPQGPPLFALRCWVWRAAADTAKQMMNCCTMRLFLPHLSD
jgi:hypothetical protein